MKKLFNFSFFYLILALLMGVFYREFTKFNNFTGVTALKSIHGHLMILGFIFTLALIVLNSNFNIIDIKNFNKWFTLYNCSLLFTTIILLVRGILQVLNKDMAGLSHIAGLAHFLLGFSLIYFMILIKKSLFVSTKSIN